MSFCLTGRMKKGEAKLESSSSGFCIPGVVNQIDWDCVYRISAFKRDEFTSDLLCFELEFNDGDMCNRVVIHEELEGFENFLNQLENSSLELAREWRKAVFAQTFDANLTVVFERITQRK
jgi:hypothetical protein